MKIIDILEKLIGDDSLINKENLESNLSRRASFKHLSQYGKKFALATIPFGIASLSPTKVLGAHVTATPVEVLNFALLLEYLEAEYYMTGLAKVEFPTSKARAIYEQISKHENAHVEFLKSTIQSLGAMPIEKPEFDFTAGGTFPDPFAPGNYGVFMALSQGFEDLGVRAYKGQAANLIDEDALLTAALRIHSVEARHASEVRRLRGEQGWIPFEKPIEGFEMATQPIYDGEAEVVQAGVDVRNLTDVAEEEITESFDEPLTMDEVKAIATLFIVD